MKLLTALIASAIVLVPSAANAVPNADRQVIVDTFCSWPTLFVNKAEDDCVELAFELDSKRYDLQAIKRHTDRFTSRVTGTGIITVSTWTSGKIDDYLARNAR